MKNVHGIWLPDHEKHLLTYATKRGWTYQKHKLTAAVKMCKKRKLAIDIGGHCGLWSMHLVKLFDQVVAFEPVKDHRDCYVKNVSGNYVLHPYGLGDRERKARIHTTQGSSGDSYVEDGDSVEVKTLDSFVLEPSFIKIDTEGFEYYICLGGEKTIRENKPVMVVEQKPDKGGTFGLGDTDAVSLLETWGYKVIEQLSGDYILKCD